ncbi:MAG: hypothetical protein CVU50_04600 [Candidatus Cloacimonetes bacterium HGW-Cloacimonetes-3]|jgi:hypothetical protein|nr:MAG: hypothetical protein CVU50_04600 [Candidatus Cloacimonetes bacterium HGW-Cloacimonetes-3]
MKRIIFASAIFWLLCSSALLAQAQGLDFYLYSSEHVQSIENNLQYRYFPFANTSLDISGHSSIENRLNFDQESKNSEFKLGFNISQKLLQHSFYTDYKSIYDASALEASPYVNKTASLGYQLSFKPVDSLSVSVFSNVLIRNEQDRYVNNSSLSSDGWWLGANGNYAAELGALQGGLSAGAERKKLAWEAFESGRMGVYLNLFTNNLVFDTSININQRSDDIYTLNAPSGDMLSSFYSPSEAQKRNKLSFNGTVQYIPDDSFIVSFSDTYNQSKVDYKQNTNRNNTDSYNLSSVGVNFALHPRLMLESSLSQSINNREYENTKNNRLVEARRLENRIVWEYMDSDSLIVSASLDLQATSYPSDNHNYDNDLLTGSYRIGWKHYWHERIKIGMWLGFAQSEDVYINSILSANNRNITSFSMQPNCQIILGDRIALLQTYQLKADYNDYIYGVQTGKENTFYRQVAYKYNLIFDTYPYIARSGDIRWLKLPFRNSPDNALLIDMNYAFEENQYADEVADYYSLHTKNRRYTAAISLRHDIKTLFWTLTPKYTWGTWQEYSLLFGVAWQFNNASLVELSVSPYGVTTEELDWRSSLNLNLRF